MDANTQMPWRVDLHVHTRRFSPCAESLDPERLGLRMKACGLHGVVITEHDRLWPEADIVRLNRRLVGRRIYRGVEVSSRNGHFVVIGLKHMRGIKPGISAEELVHVTHCQDAAVILAHPQITYSQMHEPLALSEMPTGIHAVEVASTVTVGRSADEVAAFARKTGLVMVGGSDAHFLEQVGQVATCFARLPTDEDELAADIRNGRCAVMHDVEMALDEDVPLELELTTR